MIGGQRAAATNKANQGEDWYRRIGALGGSVRCRKGFALDRGRASRAGALGGRISRRNGIKLSEKERREIHRAYKELLAVQKRATRERTTARLDEGATLVYDRKRGLVR